MKDIIISDEYKKPELYYLAKLPIAVNSKLMLIELHCIMYIEAYSSYSKIYTTKKDDPFLSSKNIGYFEKQSVSSPELRFFLITGVCGGYTTFSTFSNENIQLIHSNQIGTAFLYTGISVIVGFVMTFFGLWITK